MTMLNGTLALWDVQDGEALCQSLISRHQPSAELQPHEREDLLAWLVENLWELSLDYNPAQNPNGHHHPSGGFSGWAAHILRLRIPEWHRTHTFRTHWRRWDGTYRRIPDHLPLDDEPGLEQGLRPRDLDSHPDSLADLMREARTRSSPGPRAHSSPHRRAA